METRANYVVIGAFTLAAVVGAFLFVMWIAGYATPGGHRTFQVVFNGSVSGLSNGANVLFNGIKVGEVTHLTFSRSDPHQVVADIDVSADAPIDRNTKARLETAGITGAAAVALLGGSTPGAPLVGENGQGATIHAEQSMQLQEFRQRRRPFDQGDRGSGRRGENHHRQFRADPFGDRKCRCVLQGAGRNAPGIDAALKSVGELGKQIGPLAARLQTLSDDADRVVQSIDPDQVRAIVDNVQNLSAKGRLGRRSRRQASCRQLRFDPFDASERRVFAKTLADNAPNVDTTLKNLAEISKTIQPVVAQIQTLPRTPIACSRRSTRTRSATSSAMCRRSARRWRRARTISRVWCATAPRSPITSTISAKRLDTALVDVDQLMKAVDSQKIAGIVDQVNDVVATVRQNRGNVDITLKNFGELSGKLNNSADKVDGVLASAQSFLGSPSTKGAVDRISEAAQSVKKLADDTDAKVKDIAGGLEPVHQFGPARV